MGASYEVLKNKIEKEVADSQKCVISGLTKLYDKKSDIQSIYN